MILVTAAAGTTGLAALAALAGRGEAVRAFVTKEASAARCRALGAAETVVGDLLSAADRRRALDGARAVYHIGPRFWEHEREVGLAMVRAAREAGVRHFVMHSVYHPQCRKMLHHAAKLDIEEALVESGLEFTILQAAMYMQNVRLEWPVIVKDGVYRRPYSPERRMAVVDTDDMGEAAAIVLTRPGFTGAAFELCGRAPLTTADMARIVGEELGRPVRAEKLDLDAWAAHATGQGWTPWAIDAYGRMCRHYDEFGFPGGNPLALRAILGREPNDFRAFAKKFVAATKAERF